MSTAVHDLAGIGLGPFNLGLACLAAPLGVDAVFLEAREEPRWHPGMMLEDATLQVPFLADLVTMADPTSRYSFLAHLKAVGRLYPFYVRESFYPMRREYDDYLRWAAEQVEADRPGTLRTGHAVTAVTWDAGARAYALRSRRPDGSTTELLARRLVLGVGTVPHLPTPLAGLAGDPDAGDAGPVLHTAVYLHRRDALLERDDVTVVGSGQSAAEVFSDLLDRARPDVRLRWLTRSPRYFPLEYTKLTLELTSPEYSAHFRGLPAARRAPLLASQAGLYKGISGDLVDRIHEQLYRRSLTDAVPPQLATSSAVTAAARTATGGVRLELRHTETEEAYAVTTDAVVAGTGYRAHTPAFLDGVADRLRTDERGRPEADGTFRVDRHTDPADRPAGPGAVFVQNAELATHGFVAPDLGMGAWRNAAILAALLGHEPYHVERRTAFQEFGVPADAERLSADRPAEALR